MRVLGLLVGVLGLAVPAHAQDVWCRGETLGSLDRRAGVESFLRKRDVRDAGQELEERLRNELISELAAQVTPQNQAAVRERRAQIVRNTVDAKKVPGMGWSVCVEVQADRVGLLSRLPDDVGADLLRSWTRPVADFAAGRRVYVRDVVFVDAVGQPEVDADVVPRLRLLVQRSLGSLPQWTRQGFEPPPDDTVVLDVKVEAEPDHYSVVGVVRSRDGTSRSLGADLSRAWLGRPGTRVPAPVTHLQIDRFDAPSQVVEGAQAKVAWKVINASSCFLEGPNGGDVPLEGSLEVSPRQDATWILRCTDGFDVAERTRSVRVVPPTPAATLRASERAVRSGATVQLTWTAEHVERCTLEPGFGAVSLAGARTATVRQDTTWTLLCTTAESGNVVQQVSVRAGEPPVVRGVEAELVGGGPLPAVQVTVDQRRADRCQVEVGNRTWDLGGDASIRLNLDRPGSYRFHATCSNAFGEASGNAEVDLGYVDGTILGDCKCGWQAAPQYERRPERSCASGWKTYDFCESRGCSLFRNTPMGPQYQVRAQWQCAAEDPF